MYPYDVDVELEDPTRKLKKKDKRDGKPQRGDGMKREGRDFAVYLHRLTHTFRARRIAQSAPLTPADRVPMTDIQKKVSKIETPTNAPMTSAHTCKFACSNSLSAAKTVIYRSSGATNLIGSFLRAV